MPVGRGAARGDARVRAARPAARRARASPLSPRAPRRAPRNARGEPRGGGVRRPVLVSSNGPASSLTSESARAAARAGGRGRRSTTRARSTRDSATPRPRDTISKRRATREARTPHGRSRVSGSRRLRRLPSSSPDRLARAPASSAAPSRLLRGWSLASRRFAREIRSERAISGWLAPPRVSRRHGVLGTPPRGSARALRPRARPARAPRAPEAPRGSHAASPRPRARSRGRIGTTAFLGQRPRRASQPSRLRPRPGLRRVLLPPAGRGEHGDRE